MYSKGCQLCQQGKWLCIFLTYKCNANCKFCPAPYQDDHIHSAFGNKKEEILSFLIESDIEGISFSGGDPFVVFERLVEWFLFFKQHLPDYYYWVYTNGLDADHAKLEILSTEGMDEIRFNIAATGYLSPIIWERIKYARKLFSHVTVEIPSIKRDNQKLSKALVKMNEIGIDYLNLHDYILQDSDPNTTIEETHSLLFNKLLPLKYAFSSIEHTKQIIEQASNLKYNFQINNCSMLVKEHQMLQRRLKMSKIFCDPDYDYISEDGLIHNFYDIPKKIDLRIQNDNLGNSKIFKRFQPFLLTKAYAKKIQTPEGNLVKISFVPQLELNGDKVMLGMKILNITQLRGLLSDSRFQESH